MREIKFRAWDEKKRKYTYSFEGYCFRNHTNDGEEYQLVVSGEGPSDDYYELEMEQFTGLKDKNGKEIYEGDIVTTPKGKAPVIFNLGCFYARTISNYRLGGWQQDCVEVIGNIHENPGLLKEKK